MSSHGDQPGRGDARRGWLAPVGLLFLAFTAATLLAPAGNPLEPPAGLADRLFPGVSPAFAAARLTCLALGIGWLLALGGAGARRWSDPAPRSPAAPAPPPSPEGASRARLALAAGLAVGSALAWGLRAGFGPPLQLAWLTSLLLPALALSRWKRPGICRAELGVLVVTLAWMGIAVAAKGGDLRPATLVDLWQSFEWMQTAGATGANPLLESGQPGIGNVYMLLIGHPWLYDGGPDDFRRLQWVHGLWLCLSGIGVVCLLRETLPGRAPTVALATFLFSPFVLALALSPSPFGIFMALGSGALALVARYRNRGSPAALVGAASLLGLGMMSAYLWPWVLAAGAVGAIAWLRRTPRSLGVAAVALLVFGAAALASLPSLRTVDEMPQRYGERAGPWTTLEALLLGQRPADFEDPENVWTADPADRASRATGVALGAALSPFAAPRTPIRLWLDALFDPVSTWLAALGLGAALLAVRRSREARTLVALLAVAVLPAALASAYDRTSLLRNLLLPVPIALLAVYGLEQLTTRLGVTGRGARRLRAGLVFAIAACGLFVFDVWTPRRLPESAIAIALESLEGQPPSSGRIWLDFGRPDRLEFLYTETILAQVATGPFDVVYWKGARSLDAASAVVAPALVFWSAGLESQHGIASSVCTRWPSGNVYPLIGRSGHSRAFAIEPSVPAGATPWLPALPAGRSARISCADLPALLGAEADGRTP